MEWKYINTIISKYLDQEATASEENFLLEWIKDKDNREYFEEFIRANTWIAHNYNTSIIDKELDALSIDAPLKGKNVGRNLLKYAAVLIAICATAFIVYDKIGQTPTTIFDKNTVSLEVFDGSSNYYDLENATHFSLENEGISLENGSVLHYLSDRASSEEKHTIHVPYGKTFEVVLSDGSKVKLNSGSRFTYPASFNGQESRAVTLVGEGYFDIAKSTVPFQVKTENLTTEVLGTVFNISAYEDDVDKEVILVEGSVRLFQGAKSTGKSKMLMPGQKANTQSPDGELLVESIDIEDYLGWTEGALVFYKDDMAAILKKLERKFNIRIENTYEKLNPLSFSGKFSSNETLEEVLNTMRAHTDFSYSKSETNIVLIYEPANLKGL